MDKNWVQEIEKVIVENQVYLRAGYPLWNEFWNNENNKNKESVGELIRFLIKLFQKEEKEIAIERNRPYVTDNYERGIISFALDLMQKLLNVHEELDGRISYIELLSQKHMAYAFYHLLDQKKIVAQHILEDSKYRRRIYEGLVKFYESFFGLFSDNEEAIKLLCEYFPIRDFELMPHEDIVNALMTHIKIAGTPTDLGYAFRGIEHIQKYIGKLPKELSTDLIKQYNLYDILNQRVRRHQLYTIIEYSNMTDDEKRMLKFFYLDSLMIADMLNHALTDAMNRQGTNVKHYLYNYDLQIGEDRIDVFDSPEAYWSNVYGSKRCFIIDGQEKASITLTSEGITFKVEGKADTIELDNYEWEWDNYRRNDTRKKIQDLVLGANQHKEMTFSLLYLNHYRQMETRTLDFDHRFVYSEEHHILESREEGLPRLHFYGEAVYSLSCIVGKNGTGKTSVIDFLRGTFYKILRMVQGGADPDMKGCVSREICQAAGFEGENSEFLVVFRFGDQDYYLTNIKDLTASGIAPFESGVNGDPDEFCKVAYFSQQLRADQRELFYDKIENVSSKYENTELQNLAKHFETIRQCDYSEMTSFVITRNSLAVRQNSLSAGEEDHIVNRDFIYQISLLKYMDEEEFCNYLDIENTREFTIYNLESNVVLETFLLHECKEECKIKELAKKYAKIPDIRIGRFSSGQYAKFSFLARMHWFLNGKSREPQYYNELLHGAFFSGDDVLQADETALIFIDEGELYYHPEWQRRFLSTLLDMLHVVPKESKVQIIFTTNSPFVISDLFKEDVQYLSDQAKGLGDTLGQNIHTLLKNNFFMNYTIGEYSRELIDKIIGWLGSEESESRREKVDFSCYFDDSVDEYEAVSFLIQQIGEPVYRKKLEEMLREREVNFKSTYERKIFELENQKNKLEEEIERLRKEVIDGGKA